MGALLRDVCQRGQRRQGPAEKPGLSRVLRPLPSEETLTENKGCRGCQRPALGGSSAETESQSQGEALGKPGHQFSGADLGRGEAVSTSAAWEGQGRGAEACLHSIRPALLPAVCTPHIHLQHGSRAPAVPPGAARPPPAQASFPSCEHHFLLLWRLEPDIAHIT